VKDEWAETYSLVMPMLGVVLAAFGLGLSVLMLRSQEQAAGQTGTGGLEPPSGVAVDVPRVRYSDGEIYVEVRDPGQWFPMTSFVQPDDSRVRQIVRQLI